MAHARGSSEGSQGCREDADDDLNDGLPSFFLHSAFMVFLGVNYYGGSPAGAEAPSDGLVAFGKEVCFLFFLADGRSDVLSIHLDT